MAELTDYQRRRRTMWICLVIAAIALFLVIVDTPVVFGRTILDGPDPNRPGHMIGITISPFQYIGEVLAVIFAIVFAWRNKN